jgi:putative two-component system response regulator
MQKTIFVVDDGDTNLTLAKEALQGYRVMTMPSALRMFALLEKVMPDLILLDIKMPEMDGFAALRRLKASSAYADIPVIFLTGMNDVPAEVRGFQLGVVDFITKPFSVPVLLNRVKTHLDIDARIRERTEEIRERTEQLQRLKDGIVCALADIVESRDQIPGGHVERTVTYIDAMLQAMLERGIYSDELCGVDYALFTSSARLHDVGKIAIPDSILNKPCKLTEDEFAIMKTHAAEGERIIDQIVTRVGHGAFLQNAKLFAGYHHERWDGRGYPYGLAETDIPLQGRIMAVADVYDALVSLRPYKKAFSSEEALSIIRAGAGTQFDPLIADAFCAASSQFQAIMPG